MKTLKNIIIVLTLGFTNSLAAQNINFTTDNFTGREAVLEEALKAMREGDKYFSQAQTTCASLISPCGEEVVALYENALTHYLTAQNINSNNAWLNSRIGECYIHTQKEKAMPYLQKALSLDERTNANAYLFMGMTCQHLGQFDEAINYYQKYKTKLTVEQYNQNGLLADRFIAESRNATALMSKPVRAFVDNLGVATGSNTSASRPIVSADGQYLYYNESYHNGKTSANKVVRVALNGQDTTYMEIPKAGCGKSVNTMLYLSNDTRAMILSRNKNNKTDLYETYIKDNGVWAKPKRLKKPVASKYNENSAYISPKGNVLFFSSDRPGGYGGFDIYMARRDERGKWLKGIINLGAGVNSPYNEHISYISPDGNTIYFSSEGHTTMGGADIFKSTYNAATQTWSEAENVGYPINSAGNETFFYPIPDNKLFYLSSSREGGLDIYRAALMGVERNIVSTYEDNMLAYHSPRFMEYLIEPVVQLQTKTVAIATISGMVIDKATQQPVHADISIIDNAKNKTVAQFQSSGETGRFTAMIPEGTNYGMTVKATGYMFQSENLNIPAGAGREYHRFIELSKLGVNSTITLNNIFFDTGKSKPTQASQYELEMLLNMLTDQPTVKIEVSGHTDNRGSDEANQRLSNLRAKAVVDYLIRAGIEPDRLSYIGYGITKPVASNATADGRRLNRRTEVRIVSK